MMPHGASKDTCFTSQLQCINERTAGPNRAHEEAVGREPQNAAEEDDERPRLVQKCAPSPNAVTALIEKH